MELGKNRQWQLHKGVVLSSALHFTAFASGKRVGQPLTGHRWRLLKELGVNLGRALRKSTSPVHDDSEQFVWVWME